MRATTLFVVVSVAVALMPFKHAIRFGAVALRPRKRANADDVVWAVETAARWLPWRVVCIEKGLVAQRMLRRLGMDALLSYGARHHPDTQRLEAHVWVTVDGRPVIGGEEAAGFGEIATFP